MKHTTTTALGAITLALALATALTGCSAAIEAAEQVAPGSADATVADSATVYRDAEIGTCILDPGLESGADTPASETACDTPHQSEVFEHFDLTSTEDNAFPGDEQIATEADPGCVAAFSEYVGVLPESSSLVYTALLPDTTDWANGIHVVTCILTDGAGEQLTGTARGSGL